MKAQAHPRSTRPSAAVGTALAVALLCGCGSTSGASTSTTTAITTPTTPAHATANVRIYLSRGDPGPNCNRVVPVVRTVPAPAVLRGTVTALLRGPTAAERAKGYGGWFTARTAGRLRSVRLRAGVAHIDFRDFSRIIPNASTSCGSSMLLAQLNRTVLRFPTVRRAVYSFDGSAARFYHWLQMDVPTG